MRDVHGHVGEKYGRLTILKRVENTPSNATRYLCRCDCGNETIALLANITRGHTLSCGCLQRERASEANTTHGMSRTRIHRIWIEMKNRCYLESDTSFNKYGSRGITVCDEWKNDFQSFYDWSTSHGYRDDLTLDRIDNDGNYYPENCRWVTYSEQNKNRRKFRRKTK